MRGRGMASRCLSIVTVIDTVICGVNCEFVGMKEISFYVVSMAKN